MNRDDDCVSLDVYTDGRCPTSPMIFKILCPEKVDEKYVCDCLHRVYLENEKIKDYEENGNINKTLRRIKEFNDEVAKNKFKEFVDDNGFLPYPYLLFTKYKFVELGENFTDLIDKTIDTRVFISFGEKQPFIEFEENLIDKFDLIDKVIPYVLQIVTLKNKTEVFALLINSTMTFSSENCAIHFENYENVLYLVKDNVRSKK